MQRAALRYLELGSDRIARFQRQVSRRGFLPEFTVHGDYGGVRAHDEDHDETVFASGERYQLFDRLYERERDFGVGATLRWDLGDTVYNPEEIDISKEVRELIELRDEVLDEINQLYFERRRVLLERALLPDPASPEAERLALRARELAAGLDAWTGGWWSRQVEPLSPRATGPAGGTTMKCVQGAALALALLGAAPAVALPVLSEVFYDAVGVDDGQSFIELYGAPGTSLDGLVIEGVNGADGAVTHTLTLAGSFGADGLFVVADRTSAGTTQVGDADLLLDFDFQNGPDAVVLRDAREPCSTRSATASSRRAR